MLTQERLKELLHYNPETGVFTRAKDVRGGFKKGDVVGHEVGAGYLRVVIDNGRYYLHRLAWLYIHGEMPNGEIDHKNRIKTDNRIDNLRVVSKSHNQQNKGGLGVQWHKAGSKWRAYIKVDGKHRHIGLYDCLLDARAAYLRAKREFHSGYLP